MFGVAPPSLNPNDGGIPEPVMWHEVGEPAVVPTASLRRAVCEVAGVALLARPWPTEGWHFAALYVAGALLRSGWTPERVRRLIEAVSAAAGDDELASRLDCVESTADGEEGGRVLKCDPGFVARQVLVVPAGAVGMTRHTAWGPKRSRCPPTATTA